MYFQAPYTEENIKRQYRELAKLHHPDKGGDKEKFNFITYEKNVLLNLIGKKKPNQKLKYVKKVLKVRRPAKKILHFHFDTNKLMDKIIKEISKKF